MLRGVEVGGDRVMPDDLAEVAPLSTCIILLACVGFQMRFSLDINIAFDHHNFISSGPGRAAAPENT